MTGLKILALTVDNAIGVVIDTELPTELRPSRSSRFFSRNEADKSLTL